MKIKYTRLFGLLILAPLLVGGCEGDDKVVSMGGEELEACAWEDCKPAMGMPNWECSDGRVGGPACLRSADGTCGWQVIECTPVTSACERIPQCQFPCPAGKNNPVDEQGCVHTCECVSVQCSAEDCGPAPGMPNWQCPDGSVGGPSCSVGADGVCGWQIIDCPPDTDPCANISQCEFLCPPGMKNPVDERGCTHTCECVQECSNEDCGPAPGMPNWQCPDGTIAGPQCSIGADGVCGWQIIDCPPDTDP
jgi:hypothetical protein